MATAPYIELVSCCDPSIILNFRPSNILESSIYQYTGVTENGLVTNSCYTVTQKTGTISYVIGLPEVNILYLIDRDTCDNELCACIIPCYTLYACDGSYFNTTTDLSANVGTYIRIEESDKTWYVIGDDTKTTCENALDVVLDLISPIQVCTLNCYQVTGTPATVTYMDANYDIVTVIGATKVCSYITPIVTGSGSGFVVELGECVEGECPEICFEFTNCQTDEVLVVSNSPSVIFYYAQDQIVTLQGYDGCWSIKITEACECPVSVTILTAYASCIACLPIVNYKFTNCNNQAIIRYSTEDYSAYVGKTVELECGECWFVSEIDYMPPSTQPIDILYTFDNCAACAKTYYELTNCLDNTEIIYTSSNITLNPIDPTNCDCIKVTYVINNQTVILETLYQSSGYYFSQGGRLIFEIIWNNDTEVWDLSYGQIGRLELIGTLDNSSNCPFGNFTINSTGIAENITSLFVEPCTPDTIISIKECAGCWIVRETREPINPTTVTQLETYGNCEDCAVIPPTPEPEPLLKRKVKPGYSTPTCDIEKYEKITCRSSEILYKEVMRLRYGLTNCCPEDDDKWLIKKELIDLDALRDPDYICKPVTSCCNQPINDCGCNSTLKTCNSQ